MKEALNNFEIKAIVQEFQLCVGGYIENIYQLSKDEFLIYIRINRERKKIYLKLGKYIFQTKKEIETPRTPSSFALLLRKHLKRGRINEIKQHEFDRVIEFRIKENYRLIFELFRKGNAILVFEDKIIHPLKTQKFRHRELKAKKEYIYPPMKRNPFQLSREDFIEILKNSKKEIVKTLAIDINLSSIYAEEVCKITGIDKNSLPKFLSLENFVNLFNALEKILMKFKEKLEPVIILKEGKVIDIAPIKLKIYENFEFQKKDTFSSAIEYIFFEEKKRALENDYAKERLERQIKQQKEAIKKFKNEIEEGKKIAELIYLNYSICEEILKKIKEKKELENMIELNLSSKYVTISLNDGEKDIKVKLDINKSVSENASIYFQRSKKAKKKLEGAIEALKKTESKIERKKVERKIEKKKTFWFEKFRWFVSSNGILIIGGKDAKSNEIIVKKYLKERDKYIHADIHGAPSVVVKKIEQKEIDEQSLREACEFALAYSKAWNAGIGYGGVYWVDASQVSKATIPGQYLPKGSFVIRGKRNYFKLKIQAGVGEIEIDGVKKIVGGAVTAIKNKAKKYVIIEPGNIKKNDFAKKLSKIFGVRIEVMLKALPPGDVRIVEKKGIEMNYVKNN